MITSSKGYELFFSMAIEILVQFFSKNQQRRERQKEKNSNLVTTQIKFSPSTYAIFK